MQYYKKTQSAYAKKKKNNVRIIEVLYNLGLINSYTVIGTKVRIELSNFEGSLLIKTLEKAIRLEKINGKKKVAL